MKRKSIVVLLVLLLVGILAFTAFACNNNGGDKDKPGTGDKPGGGDGTDPGGDDDDNTEDTNAINDALPALLGGLDQVASKVGKVSGGAYLKANIALGLSLDEEIDLDLKLSLAASMDKNTSANNWALIGLGTSEKDIVNLYIKGTADDEEIIYLGEILTTGKTAWHKVSVLDVSASETLDGIFLSKSENDNNSGLIERVFNFLGDWNKLLGPIDFSSDAPISNLSFKLSETGEPLVLGKLLSNPIISPIITQLLSAKATENGYSASLIVDNIGKVLPMIASLLEGVNLAEYSVFTELLLGLKIGEGNVVTPVEEDDATPPSLNINFDLAENGDLSMLEIAFANDNVAGHNVALNLKIDGIEAEAASKAAADPAGITGAEDLGLHLSLNAKTPAIGAGKVTNADATIDLYVNPDIKIGFAKEGDAAGYIQFDLSGLEAYATFTAGGNTSLIAEYVNGTGVLVNLAPVFAYAGVNEGQDATYLISGTEDVQGWLNGLITNPAGNKPAGGNQGTEEAEGTISNASLAGPIDTIIGLIKEYTEAAAEDKNILGLISGILKPALTDSDSVVGGLLAIIGDADSGLDIDKDADDGEVGVEINFEKLIYTLCADNGLIDSMEYEFQLYDTADPNADKAPVTLKQILQGGDILDYLVDFIYTAKYDAYCEGLKEGVTADDFATWYAADKGKVTKQDIIDYAKDLGIDLSGDDLAAKLGTLTATVTMGAGGDFKVALSLLGASLSISADFAYVDTTETLEKDGENPYITSGNNAELVAALAQLGFAYMPSFAPEAAA